MKHRLTLLLTMQAEGGFTITCEELPELITECDTLDDAISNVIDAFLTVVELYKQENRVLPTLVKNKQVFVSYHLPSVNASHILDTESNSKYVSEKPNPINLDHLAMAVYLNELPESGTTTKRAWM